MRFLKPFLYQLIFAAFILLCAASGVQAQYKVKGNVYDSSHIYPLEAVSVLSTNGSGTATDANGHYIINVGEKDSIWFSYLGKPTVKFPVLKMADVSQFDIALQVNITVLKEITIRPPNYKQDSTQNRQDYAKAFNFQRPNMSTITSIGPTGAGIDIDEVIRAFQFRKNKSMQRFQTRLIQQEQDKSVDHRFSKALVRRLTGLTDDALTDFMLLYRPTFEFTQYSNDYDFQLYIKESYLIYNKLKNRPSE